MLNSYSIESELVQQRIVRLNCKLQLDKFHFKERRMKITNPMPYDFKTWVRGNDIEEWGPHKPQDDMFIEWRWFTAFLNGSDGEKYFLYIIFEPCGEFFIPMINAEVNGNYTNDKPLAKVFYRLINVNTEKTIFYHQEFTDVAYDELYNVETKTWYHESSEFSASLQYTGDAMRFMAKDNKGYIEVLAQNPGGEARWYNDPAIGQEGFMRQGLGYTMYNSCPNMTHYGQFSTIDEDGNKTVVQFEGRGWLDNQVCDLADLESSNWEWTGLLFADGDRINLYNFTCGLQMCTWFKADGTREQTDVGFLQKQTGYTRLESGIWVSFGWEFEIPVKDKIYKVVPYCPNLMPAIAKPFGMLETLGILYDEHDNQVGYATTESMDVKGMDNGPYGSKQQ